MLSSPKHAEIDGNTIKLLIGLIALTLANITSMFSANEITSISASYHEGGWARNFFVGFLFAISAFMIAYNGFTRNEMLMSKAAALAAFGVAMFPCGCGNHAEVIPYVHYISAAIMFSVLAYFCYLFFKRATSKGHVEAIMRSKIYVLCGLVIVMSMLVMAVDYISGEVISNLFTRLTFYCERAGLIAFGISWLTASKILPFLASDAERIHPLS